MIRGILALAAITFIIVYFGYLVQVVTGEAPPKLPQQPHGDFFDCGGGRTCDQFNPITQQIRATRAVTWRFVLVSGCQTNGNTEASVRRAIRDGAAAVQLTGAREVNNAPADVTIYGSCGPAFAAVCGGPPVVGCLGRGYPSSCDIDISLVMDTWSFNISRDSVVWHELFGHCFGSWDEQYCKGLLYPRDHICAGKARFAEAPGWIDFMNVGASSRHAFAEIELARWERTMWLLQEPEPEPCIGPTNVNGHAHDSCNGWWVSVTDASVGIGNIWHYTPVAGFTGWEWGACTAWGGRDNRVAQLSDTAGASTYVWWLQRWVTAPAC